MKTFLTASLLALSIMPVVAQAHTSREELRRDRQDIREQQYQLRDAHHYGNWRDVRRQHEDVRDARQEYREDLRDWRRGHDYRRHEYLPRTRYGHRWVRDHRDALLIDTRSGRVIRVIPRYWG